MSSSTSLALRQIRRLVAQRRVHDCLVVSFHEDEGSDEEEDS